MMALATRLAIGLRHCCHSHWAALIAGATLTLAFAPFSYTWLAPVALAVLFWGWFGATPIQAAWRGWWFGLGLFGSGISWVYYSLHDFSGAGVVLSTLITLVFVTAYASFVGLAGYLGGMFTRPGTLDPLLLYPSAWLLAEYLRGQVVLNGFPWLLVGYSQESGALGGFIPLCGVYGTGFLVAAGATGLALAIAGRLHAWLCALGLALLWGGGLACRDISWTYALGAPFQATLVQGNMPQHGKWLPENRERSLRRYRELTAQHWDSPLLVWPETAVPATYDLVKDSFIAPLHQEAQRQHSKLLVPLPVHDTERQAYYNAALLLGGAEIAAYHKIHLVPFGEYLPLRPWSGKLAQALGAHVGNFIPGDTRQPLLSAAGYPFATSICYEDAFADEALRGMPEAAFLVNVTNDSWFGEGMQPWQHLQMARTRALETGRFLIRATNSGVSAIVDAKGRTLATAPQGEVAVLTAKITPMAGMTPYARLGDAPFIGLPLLMMLGASAYRRLRPA